MVGAVASRGTRRWHSVATDTTGHRRTRLAEHRRAPTACNAEGGALRQLAGSVKPGRDGILVLATQGMRTTSDTILPARLAPARPLSSPWGPTHRVGGLMPHSTWQTRTETTSRKGRTTRNWTTCGVTAGPVWPVGCSPVLASRMSHARPRAVAVELVSNQAAQRLTCRPGRRCSSRSTAWLARRRWTGRSSTRLLWLNA